MTLKTHEIHRKVLPDELRKLLEAQGARYELIPKRRHVQLWVEGQLAVTLSRHPNGKAHPRRIRNCVASVRRVLSEANQ